MSSAWNNGASKFKVLGCGHPGLKVQQQAEQISGQDQDPLAFEADALIPWTQFKLIYAFPLIKILLQLLRKMEAEWV